MATEVSWSKPINVCMYVGNCGDSVTVCCGSVQGSKLTFQRTGPQDHHFTDFGGPARLLVVLIDHNKINAKQCKLCKHFFTMGVTVFCSKKKKKLYP